MRIFIHAVPASDNLFRRHDPLGNALEGRLYIIIRAQHDAQARQAVAPAAPKLLVISIGIGRNVQMKHRPHIALVNADAEGGCRRHDGKLIVRPGIDPFLSHSARRLAREGLDIADPMCAEEVSDVFRLNGPCRIDDHGVRHFLHEFEHLSLLVGKRFRLDEHIARLMPQSIATYFEPFLAVLGKKIFENAAARLIKRRGKKNRPNAGIALQKPPAPRFQTLIIDAEGRTPIDDDMRLIDHKVS